LEIEMRHTMKYIAVMSLMILFLAACGAAEDTARVPAEAAPGAPQAAAAEVLETMDSGGYTYVRLKTDDGEVWAAGPATPIAVGDRIVLGDGMVMNDFHSQTLDRTFDSILFLSALSKPGEAGINAIAANPHEAAGAVTAKTGKTVAVVETGSVPKAEGGHTVAELYAGKAELAGKEVSVMGRVVKYNGGIMGKNWLHVKDGSGETGTDNLTVTTAAVVAVGDLVLVQGKVTLDKDFGAGYSYDLIIEDATVTVQP
jgi:hypothetical protein